MEIKLESLWQLARTTEYLAAQQEPNPLAILRAARLTPVRRFELNRQLAEIEREMANLENVRMEAVMEYGTEETLPDGQTRLRVMPDTPNAASFFEKMTPLLQMTVQITGQRFSLAELGDMLISGDALDALKFLFIEYEEKE